MYLCNRKGYLQEDFKIRLDLLAYCRKLATIDFYD